MKSVAKNPSLLAHFASFLAENGRFCHDLARKKDLKTDQISNKPFLCNDRSALGREKN